MNQIGHYELQEEIGRGGMGVVYRARQVLMDEVFALKLIHAEHANNEEFRRRFLAEAKTLYKLKHPGIVEFRELGETQRRLFLVTELLSGETLETKLARSAAPHSPQWVAETLRQAAEALAFGHRLGVVHRDIKPGNIFLHQPADGSRQVKLLDFGLARDGGGGSLTASGMAVGTPAYLPPEVLKGQRADARADIYALGLIGFELLCGRKPALIPESASSVWAKVTLLFEAFQKGLPRVRELRPDVPEGLATLIDACLALEPEGRPADGAAFLAELNKAGEVAKAALRPAEKTPVPDLDTTLLGIGLSRPQTEPSTSPKPVPTRRPTPRPTPPPRPEPEAESEPKVESEAAEAPKAKSEVVEKRDAFSPPETAPEAPRSPRKPPTEKQEEPPVAPQQAEKRRSGWLIAWEFFNLNFAAFIAYATTYGFRVLYHPNEFYIAGTMLGVGSVVFFFAFMLPSIIGTGRGYRIFTGIVNGLLSGGGIFFFGALLFFSPFTRCYWPSISDSQACMWYAQSFPNTEASYKISPLSRACALGNEQGCLDAARTYFEVGQASEAMSLLERSCQAGKGYNCSFLGDIYYSGLHSVTKDEKTANDYYREACNHGVGKACFYEAYYYRTVLNAPALALYKKGCMEKDSWRSCAGASMMLQIMGQTDEAKKYAEKGGNHPVVHDLAKPGYVRTCGGLLCADNAKEQHALRNRCYQSNDASACFEAAFRIEFSDHMLADTASVRNVIDDYAKGCELKNGGSCNNLAILYEHISEVLDGRFEYKITRDDICQLYRSACNLGDSIGCQNAKNSNCPQ